VTGNPGRANLRITGPMAGPGRRFTLLVCAALTLLAAGCTSSGGDDARRTRPATVAPTPEGWMLSSGQVFGQGLTATRLPDGDPQRMGLPIDDVVFDAAWVEPGATAYAFVQPGSDQTELQLEEVGMSGDASPVGAPVRDVSSISAAGSVFLASSCNHGKGDTMVVQAGESSWKHVADACYATLSEDGRSVAFSQDGHTIQTVPVGGGAAEELFDLDRVKALATAGLGGARIEELAWGSAGLAVVLVRGPHFGVLVHADDGDRVAPVPGAPAFVGRLRWQPSGRLAAFVTFYQGQGSVIRAMDARTGEVRVLATDSRGLAGTVWAPDGTLLASLDSRGSWLFIDPDGHRATDVPVDNELPFDWGA
jgi:hypothetical protein